MNGLEAWSLNIDAIGDRLTLGLDLFGPYADYLWTVPAFWALTAFSLWFYTAWQQRKDDRVYLAYASRNLSLFRRIARQRAREVNLGGRIDRF